MKQQGFDTFQAKQGGVSGATSQLVCELNPGPMSLGTTDPRAGLCPVPLTGGPALVWGFQASFLCHGDLFPSTKGGTHHYY